MNQDRSGQSGDSTAMDAAALYIEEVFTDQRVGTIRRLTPVTADGDKDPQRKVLFQGQAQILTPNGALPINFELPADSLADAVAQFGDAAKMALEDTMRELQENASRSGLVDRNSRYREYSQGSWARRQDPIALGEPGSVYYRNSRPFWIKLSMRRPWCAVWNHISNQQALFLTKIDQLLQLEDAF